MHISASVIQKEAEKSDRENEAQSEMESMALHRLSRARFKLKGLIVPEEADELDSIHSARISGCDAEQDFDKKHQ
jgi:hypothetical protein